MPARDWDSVTDGVFYHWDEFTTKQNSLVRTRNRAVRKAIDNDAASWKHINAANILGKSV